MPFSSGPKLLYAWASRFSLRTNLLFLLLLVVGILIFNQVQNLAHDRAKQVSLALADIAEAAHEAAVVQANIITEARALLSLASTFPGAAAGSANACQAPFKRVVHDVPWLRSLSVVRPDGTVQCTDADLKSPLNLGDREYFKRAFASKDFVLSSYMIGRVSGRPALVGALPRLKDGNVESVVVASIEVDWLSQIAADIGAEHRAEMLLLDRDGTVVAGYPRNEKWEGQKLSGSQDFANLLRAPDSTARTSSLGGVERILSHVTLRDTDATVVAMLPLDAIIAEANRVAGYAIAKILAAASISFLVIWFGCQYLLLWPIRELADNAVLLGAGNLTAQIPTEGMAPELRRLADSFNKMAAQLRARDDRWRQSNDRLSALASKDALTGIANRRGFDEHLADEWNRMRRSGQPIALIIIDVDHFKRFNDRYGHVEGDLCLGRVATLLDEIGRRAGDAAARIGGEEFALVLPSTDLAVAMTIAESARAGVAALAIPHKGNPEARVTVSVGAAAMWPGRGGSVRDLFDIADAALYRAKRAGRNQVAFEPERVSLAS